MARAMPRKPAIFSWAVSASAGARKISSLVRLGQPVAQEVSTGRDRKKPTTAARQHAEDDDDQPAAELLEVLHQASWSSGHRSRSVTGALKDGQVARRVARAASMHLRAIDGRSAVDAGQSGLGRSAAGGAAAGCSAEVFFVSPRIDSSRSLDALRNSRTPTPDGVADVRQLARTEDDQDDHEQDDELRPADWSHFATNPRCVCRGGRQWR